MQAQFIIFFSVFLSVLALGNFYIYRLGRWAIDNPLLRRIYTAVFIFLAVSYILGRFSQKILSYENPLTVFLIWTGSFWFAFMVYLGIGTLSVDIITLVIKLFSKVGFHTPDIAAVRRIAAFVVWVCASIIITAGYINAQIRTVKEIPVTIKTHLAEPLTIALVTDVHLGIQIGKNDLRRMVDNINALNPDIIIIGGDLFDEDLAPVVNGRFGDCLSLLRARYGVYAVTGNHEFFGGVERAVDYMDRHGVRVLRNETVKAGPVYIAGRDDRAGDRILSKPRPPLEKVIAGIDRSLPLIVLDHTPQMLNDARSVHADLQLSGHTHHGQMWPFNYITRAIFEVSTGLVHRNGTAFYVSTGYGTWGPPIRTGSRPEIAKIIIRSEDSVAK